VAMEGHGTCSLRCNNAIGSSEMCQLTRLPLRRKRNQRGDPLRAPAAAAH
jgi:hypothetical protein